MNRLFQTLRNIVHRPAQPDGEPEYGDLLPGFDDRVEVLVKYAEQAAAYTDDLNQNYEQIQSTMTQFQEMMEKAIDLGQDREALEYLRLAARIRPQNDLLEHELRTFRIVANDLIGRVNTLMENLDEAREFARRADLNPEVAGYLDEVLTRLTRYFVMLDRVATNRRYALPERLALKMTEVIDDRKLDLELARYILNRRRALQSGAADSPQS